MRLLLGFLLFESVRISLELRRAATTVTFVSAVDNQGGNHGKVRKNAQSELSGSKAWITSISHGLPVRHETIEPWSEQQTQHEAPYPLRESRNEELASRKNQRKRRLSHHDGQFSQFSLFEMVIIAAVVMFVLCGVIRCLCCCLCPPAGSVNRYYVDDRGYASVPRSREVVTIESSTSLWGLRDCLALLCFWEICFGRNHDSCCCDNRVARSGMDNDDGCCRVCCDCLALLCFWKLCCNDRDRRNYTIVV
jgi:hypothetical protein